MDMAVLLQARTSVTLINFAPELDRLLFDAQGSSAPTASGDRWLPRGASRLHCPAAPAGQHMDARAAVIQRVPLSIGG